MDSISFFGTFRIHPFLSVSNSKIRLQNPLTLCLSFFFTASFVFIFFPPFCCGDTKIITDNYFSVNDATYVIGKQKSKRFLFILQPNRACFRPLFIFFRKFDWSNYIITQFRFILHACF